MARDRKLDPGPQARFAVDQFTRHIEQHGLPYRWSRAVMCSCQLGTETTQYDPTCSRCVDGWRYVNPCHAEEPGAARDWSPLTAVFSSITLDPTTHQWVAAPWTTGRATLTVDGHIPISYKDRFVSLSQRSTFSQVLVRGDSQIVPVGWLGRTSADQRTAFRYEPIAVHYLEDEDGNVYRRGTDFVLLGATATEPRRLQWVTGGDSPTEGDRFSVSYDCNPVWTVEDETFGVQNSVGPAAGITGRNVVQYLPTTFAVALDWLPAARGS